MAKLLEIGHQNVTEREVGTGCILNPLVTSAYLQSICSDSARTLHLIRILPVTLDGIYDRDYGCPVIYSFRMTRELQFYASRLNSNAQR